MALIEYPNTNYDTFCSVTDADTIISSYVPDTTDWDALADAKKEVYLRQSTLLIKQRISTLPTTLETELKQSTALLAEFSIDKDMSNEDDSSNVKRKKIDGVVETEYFTPSEDKSNDFPDLVESLLKKYDIESSGSFSFNRG